jgi:hypothetical protein
MPKPTTLFVGLDVHKDFITVAHAEAAPSPLHELPRPPRGWRLEIHYLLTTAPLLAVRCRRAT